MRLHFPMTYRKEGLVGKRRLRFLMTYFLMTYRKERLVGKRRLRFLMTLGKERFVGKCLEVSDTWHTPASP